MTLDFTSLEKAFGSLKRAMDRSQKDEEDTEIRDACIQRFEYTYELAWKMLKRQLEVEIADKAEVDAYSKKKLFRVGAERGLIGNPENWFTYVDKRNLTTHTYDEENAQLVYGVLVGFIADVSDLLGKLKKRHD